MLSGSFCYVDRGRNHSEKKKSVLFATCVVSFLFSLGLHKLLFLCLHTISNLVLVLQKVCSLFWQQLIHFWRLLESFDAYWYVEFSSTIHMASVKNSIDGRCDGYKGTI